MVCSAGLLTIPVLTRKRPGTIFALSRTGEGCTAPASTPRLRAATSLFEAHSAFRNFNWRSGAYPLTTAGLRVAGGEAATARPSLKRARQWARLMGKRVCWLLIEWPGFDVE